MQKKGVTAILSVILMLVITIAMAYFAYTFISNLFISKISYTLIIDNAFNDTLDIRNIGLNPIASLISVTVDGQPAVYLVNVYDISRALYYHLDEGKDTNAYDSSIYRNLGTVYNDTNVCANPPTTSGPNYCPIWTGGIYGGSMNFDGVNDYIMAPATNATLNSNISIPLNSNSVSISLWVNVTTNPNCDGNNNWRSLIRKGVTAATANGWDVVLEEDKSIRWDVGLGNRLNYVAADTNNGLGYFVSFSAILGKYNISSQITSDLRSGWVQPNQLNGVATDSAKNVTYIAGNGPVFGMYNISTGLTYNLSNTDPQNWMDGFGLNGVGVDPVNNITYIVGGGNINSNIPSIFGVYFLSKNKTYDLRGTDINNWIGPYAIGKISVDPSRNISFLAGPARAYDAFKSHGPVFGMYNFTSNQSIDLNTTYTFFVNRFSSFSDVAVDSTNGLVFFVGIDPSSNGIFGVYDIRSKKTYDLTSTNVTPMFKAYSDPQEFRYSSMFGVSVDSARNLTYISGTHQSRGFFAVYNETSNKTYDLTGNAGPPSTNFFGTNAIYSVSADSTRGIAYLGGDGIWAVYNSSSGIITDLRASANWMGNPKRLSTSSLGAAGQSEQNKWVHWIFTYNDSTGTAFIYKNGVRILSQQFSDLLAKPIWPNNYPVDIAMGTTASSCPNQNGYAPALIDEVRVYNRALTDTEIKAIYNIGDLIPAGITGTMKIYSPLTQGTHKVTICTQTNCQSTYMYIQ